MGDFNCRFDTYAQDGRERAATDLVVQNDLQILTRSQKAIGAGYSFVSYDGAHSSLIDHVLVGSSIQDSVSFCNILDDHPLNVSRHRPVVFDFCANFVTDSFTHDFCRLSLNWKKLSNEDIRAGYTNNLSQSLTDSDLPIRPLGTISDLTTYCCELTDVIVETSKEFIPVKRYRKQLKPYWSKDLKSQHDDMRKARATWVAAGKPRGHDHLSYSAYKDLKRQFRRSQRILIEEYNMKTFHDIDVAAEMDQTAFWRLVNSKRKARPDKTTVQMCFDNITSNNAKETAEGWGKYFETLYTPLSVKTFDRPTYDLVTSTPLLDEEDSPSPQKITHGEILLALKTLKRGKAPGIDNVTNEHLLFGGDILTSCLLKVFNAFIDLRNVPHDMKKGIIITLFKGGNKKRTDPNSYRAITLLSAIYKLFERVLLNRLANFFTPCPLQHGFRKGVDSSMTAILLRECVSFCKEQSSKLFGCFLDAEKAFDCVWHAGLFFKLRQLGIGNAYLATIMSMYDTMESCVVFQGHLSSWFRIRQGTRQGGVLSPWLYTVYINDLLTQLINSGCGLSIRDIPCCAPTQADDVTLLSVTKNGLQTMMDICFAYSCKWRYKFSARKSVVIVFNETMTDFDRINRSWSLGEQSVKEDTSCTHLGTNINKLGTSSEQLIQTCRKLKSTFYSSTNFGIHESGFHPLTSAIVYKSIVLQRALYGSETLSSVSSQDWLRLERAHRFCLKKMQGLSTRTRSDVVLSLIGILPISAMVSIRKLCLFGRFLTCKCNCTARDVLLLRWYRFQLFAEDTSSGFIPDVCTLLELYNLTHNAKDLDIEAPPSLQKWKQLVRARVQEAESFALLQRMRLDRELSDLQHLHNHFRPNILWTLGRAHPSQEHLFRSVIKAITSKPFTNLCQFCSGDVSSGIPNHVFHECDDSNVCEQRENMWLTLLDKLGVDVYVMLDNMEPVEQTRTLLGGHELDIDDRTLLSTVGHFFHMIQQ